MKAATARGSGDKGEPLSLHVGRQAAYVAHIGNQHARRIAPGALWEISMTALWLRLFRYSAIALSIGTALPALASDVIPDLLSNLSNAKSQVEGRAHRIQNCTTLRGGKSIEALASKYDDARNPYNGRIDAWIFVLRTRRSGSAETALEPEKLTAALLKVREFSDAADQALRKAGCPTKVLWKEVVVGAITILPPVAEAIDALMKRVGSDDKERDELTKALEQRKINAWNSISVYVVYDWSIDEFIASGQVTEAVLRKGSTSVYVNSWALKRSPGKLIVPDKLPPEGLGGSYLLYTGRIEDLNRYTDAKD